MTQQAASLDGIDLLPNPWNLKVNGKWGFVDVSKLRILRWGTLTWIIQVDPK